MKEKVKVLFASGSEDLIPTAIEHMQKLFPELPLIVVSEFPVDGVRWIPYPISRGFWENLSLFRWHFRNKRIRLSAVILQPRMPYWHMRFIAFLLAPLYFLAFNEDYGNFMLRPQSIPTIFRHAAWRTRNLFVWEFSPGGATYTFLWRLRHPGAFARPLQVLSALAAGLLTAALKAIIPPRPPTAPAPEARPRGVSVVIPSRNGRDLLADLLPQAVGQIERIGGEIIVVDNGSDDQTDDFLSRWYHTVVLVKNQKPLSFARAVNAGIQKARYSHVCLLNNDMVIADGFFEALLAAFLRMPDLFCATAQIFFPEGVRREETGKAVMPFASDRKPTDFPVRCELPSAGEDLSYVLYGSGGCSMFAAAKLRDLGGLDEVYEPAYVEDLDLGLRAWQKGWPSVFVAGARVIHKHRATTSRYYSREFLDQILELNYLRFVARALAGPRAFLGLWREAIHRLNLMSIGNSPNPAALRTLRKAWQAPFWLTRRETPVLNDGHILAIGSGSVTVVPGRTPRNRPVILLATPYLPFPLAHGGAVRMYNLMRRAAQDFDQVLVSFSGKPREVPAELREICSEIVLVKRSGSHLLPSTDRPEAVEEFDSPAFHAALRQTIRKWSPVVAQLEFTQMAQYAPDCAPVKTILVEHDVTLDLYQQLLAQGDDWELRHQLKRWIPFEIAAWHTVDRIVTMSEKDRGLTLREGVNSSRAICLPNGVDLERFQPAGDPLDSRRLLFIGSFAHLPNVLAVDFFLRDVWPRLQSLGITLHIIAGVRGQYYLDRYQDRVRIDLAQRGVELEDFVADVRPAYRRASVVIAPLLASAGTNIKIMEAMAMGKAIVSTPAGINGLDLQAGKDVIVTTSASEMANAIRELLENAVKRRAIEQQARLTVERRFNWDVIARDQKRLYEELMSGSVAYPSRVANTT